MSAEKDRLIARSDRGSYPAIARLRDALSAGREMEDAYVKWRRHSLTRMFIDALEELADSPPPFAKPNTDTNFVLLQSGMTDGLNLAAKLLKQPYRLFPEAFRGESGSAGQEDDFLDRAYEDTADDVIDGMTKEEK